MESYAKQQPPWCRASSISYRATLKKASLGVLFSITGLCAAASPKAALLLTEIHYNGPAAGTDPDEFIELTNTGSEAVDLFGYSFAQGIDYLFSAPTSLAYRQSLILARDAESFAVEFPDYRGVLLDFAGALSNSGETLALLNDLDDLLWSVSYDDSGVWPASADGGGDSLQLNLSQFNLSQFKAGVTDIANAANWIAAPPTPGRWESFGSAHDTDQDSAHTLPQPSSALLLLIALPALCSRWRRNPPDKAAQTAGG